VLQRLEVPGPVREPRAARVLAVVAAALAVHALILFAARASQPARVGPASALVAVGGALVSALLIGAVGEWLFHRYVMHRSWRVGLLRTIYDLHHRGHHWVHFRPDTYAHAGPIRYVPVWPPRPNELCETWASRTLAMLAQLGLYVAVALPLVVWPSCVVAHNPLFGAVFTGAVLLECWLFVRVHDLVHYPGKSWLQALPGFRALDHHHYLHHLDPGANTNFLMPWGDVLFGSFRVTPTADELRRWPTFEEARSRLVEPR
jgi:hypothetical protein